MLGEESPKPQQGKDTKDRRYILPLKNKTKEKANQIGTIAHKRKMIKQTTAGNRGKGVKKQIGKR
jgi:hypothetical protein